MTSKPHLHPPKQRWRNLRLFLLMAGLYVFMISLVDGTLGVLAYEPEFGPGWIVLTGLVVGIAVLGCLAKRAPFQAPENRQTHTPTEPFSPAKWENHPELGPFLSLPWLNLWSAWVSPRTGRPPVDDPLKDTADLWSLEGAGPEPTAAQVQQWQSIRPHLPQIQATIRRELIPPMPGMEIRLIYLEEGEDTTLQLLEDGGFDLTFNLAAVPTAFVPGPPPKVCPLGCHAPVPSASITSPLSPRLRFSATCELDQVFWEG